MFEQPVVIRGKHADYVKRLTSKLGSDFSNGIISRNLDVYLIAPLVGFLYNRKAKPDKGNEANDTKIFVETLLKEIDRLNYNYRLIMLLADRDKCSIEERQNRAFRYDNDAEKRAFGDAIFEEYTLGGIEVLYENIIEDAVTVDDYIQNLYNFIFAFNERYNDAIDRDGLLDLYRGVEG